MFNSLLYIPNILAYIFVSLLAVILGFIVIYVTHKIYTSIYDNLPVVQLSSKSSLSNKIKTLAQPSSILDTGVRSHGQIAGRKSTTALRIIVTMEPCYLAYMVFESNLIPKSITNKKSSLSSSLLSRSRSSISFNNNCIGNLIKYYDSLSQIPTVRDLQYSALIK